MKRLLTLLLIVIATPIFAQDSTSTKTYKNEIGIDITGMLIQFLSFKDQYASNYYNPQYFLSYRRHFGKSNLRLGMGGNFRYGPIKPFSEEDPKKFFYHSYSVNLRMGYEYTSNIGKRWQLFYGVDFRPSFVYEKNEAHHANGQYIYGSETYTGVYGIAPILGARFYITPRISIMTETNFSVNFSHAYTRETVLPRYHNSPPPSAIPEPEKSFGISGTYTQPLSLLLTFDI